MPKLIAVVTGATAGIGEGIARHLLQSGATVINVDIARPELVPKGDVTGQLLHVCGGSSLGGAPW